MKAAFALAAIGATLAAAQANLPQCGQVCIGNMLGLAPSLGCNSNDAACLCRNANFGYGVRDCANEACANAQDAQSVISYGTQYCASALGDSASASSAAGASVLSSAAGTESASGTANGTGHASSTPITTSALTAVVSSDGSVYTTTTGMTTIYSAGGGAIASATGSAASAASAASESANSVASTASEGASSVISSATEAAASAASSAASAASNAAESETSSAFAPAIITAAPALMAGALAVLVL
ncbi:uncharacterized protein MYCFIDRAFT_86075 [Pseudocercospora fijiensis CIRAD86]|uniref:CFEM domain-containing protein n=1 Tax=Pseudocercospora fijiensis (strain CIRAD86) TaxID=383855 RepID=N1Q952_PSEFD|nr:uncharacterized protein MYCFIDRAFT_86075 [Pseudocercospora fijiensis CIRAD86]EME88316.1 hypothetical protein MYCFIDRAFT_86075 [Pseudocercospora fijiensis CIRAD86]